MITTCIFDAYGTLFDVAAAARQVASEPGRADFAQHWPALSEKWRQKQLQYSWLRAITGDHTDFWSVTKDGLDWALERTGHHGDAALRKRLLALYWELQAYPEVPDMLAELKAGGKRIAAYGASAKGSTLLNFCGIGPETLDFVVDRSTVKQGKFTPGTHVPVKAHEARPKSAEKPEYHRLRAGPGCGA